MPSVVTTAFVATPPPPRLVRIFSSKVPFLLEIRCEFYVYSHTFFCREAGSSQKMIQMDL